MSCTKIKVGFSCVGIDTFTCPHCGKVYDAEKYTDRINRNKSGYTRVYCECGELFDVVVDSSGKLHGVLTLKQVIELESEIDNKYYE